MTELPLLIFDGDCGFCTSSVTFMFRMAKPRAEAIRFQQLDLERWGISERWARHEVLWVNGNEPIRGGARAISGLLRTGRQPWAFAGFMLDAIPIRWLAHVVYRVIANKRYLLPGGSDSCAVRITSE